MSGQPHVVGRLFWTSVIGGGLGFWYGRPALALTALALAAILMRALDRPRRFRKRVRGIARRHARTLALRRRQESFVDPYGNLIEDGWLRERDYFVERTILPEIEARGFSDYAEPRWDAMVAIVEEVAAAFLLPDEAEAPEDGIAYEQFCAARLTVAGWRAHATQASGDQGADIVAERDRVRLVVQCKRYAKPVGNAAVQEVAAACRYWAGDMAAVVSNAGFTPAARKLAAATGVLLLHHDDLDDLHPMRQVPGRSRSAAPQA